MDSRRVTIGGNGSCHRVSNRFVFEAEPGSKVWNAGKATADWYGEIQRYHGHVGPWNVLGWRIGQERGGLIVRQLVCMPALPAELLQPFGCDISSR